MVKDAGGTVGALGAGGESIPVPLDEVPALPGASAPGGKGSGVEFAAAFAGDLGSIDESPAACVGGLPVSVGASAAGLPAHAEE